jgi:peptide/nickel transport system permease protein
MRQYIATRCLLAIPALLIATFIVFSLPRLIPGDVVTLMLEEKAYASDIDELRAKLGLDRALPVQYLKWLGGLAQGDLGESLWTRRPVVQELVRRLPVSLTLGLMATVFAVLMALPVAILSATRQDTLADYAARSTAILGLSVPGFWLATLVIVLPVIWFGWSPAVRFTAFSASPWTYLAQFVIPALILGVASAAGIMRLTRGMLLEVLRQDYVRTASAKGLAAPRVVLKHALRNAILPVITILGIQLAQIVGGTVIIETIFGLPGMGRFLVDAILQRDYPVVQGVNLVIATVIVLSNLTVDCLYAVLDPRIRYQ